MAIGALNFYNVSNSSGRRNFDLPYEDKNNNVNQKEEGILKTNTNLNTDRSEEESAFVHRYKKESNPFAPDKTITNPLGVQTVGSQPYSKRFVLTPKGNEDDKIPVSRTWAKDSILMCAEALPPIRRLISLPDKADSGDYLGVLGAIGLTAINFPEDWRDIKTAAGQVHSTIKGEKYIGAYDYKNFQHEFSFFRGTLLEPLVDPEKTKFPKLAEKLLDIDKSLLDTKFGQKIMNLLKVEDDEFMEVKKFNKKTQTWEIAEHINGETRYARSFKGSRFGKITARAMARTTRIGIAILAALELPKIIKSMTQGDNFGEKAGSTTKQVLKSGINLASTTAGIAYGGAIGSKYGKGFGSLIGMGIGAFLGATVSQKVQDTIS